jgi:hypothetical protein
MQILMQLIEIIVVGFHPHFWNIFPWSFFYNAWSGLDVIDFDSMIAP